MPRSRPRTLPIGTISAGTLRLEDLIPAVAGALDPLRLSRAERATVREGLAWDAGSCKHADAGPCADCEDGAADLYDDLWEVASAHCPEFTSFGSHEGNGSDVGVWIDWDQITMAEKDRTVHRCDTGPHGYTMIDLNEAIEFALSVNDHGNATMYRRVRAGRAQRWIEVWAVV